MIMQSGTIMQFGNGPTAPGRVPAVLRSRSHPGRELTPEAGSEGQSGGVRKQAAALGVIVGVIGVPGSHTLSFGR